eukprot:augustus_masked-scaffold_12-processed-gene-6.59-mRNA-1 protein AED:0.01 eAED:0.01 QI:0/-1/0/1/-1/1/1/0/921
MAKKKKGVNDKYYHLAKEQGYRARSCFKLIQLNRKYNFLSTCTRLIDLCAAPGGWLQVAAQNMPNVPERQIIGVDLLPIKPVPGCVTFQQDITTKQCKDTIRKELKGKKAEVVLCDGAPNVGADYAKDAFVQSELVIHALKFAATHLVQNGIFISKVFRSSDYNALMWAFQQLFEKVEATKPPSSRNVSAEIFVVCRGYLAPTKIDPKIFNISHVFEQVEKERNVGHLLFHKKNSQKKNRDGYEENLGLGMHQSLEVSEFLKSTEPVSMLAKASSFKFDDNSKGLLNLKCTTPEIKEMCRDVKILGKMDLRALLKWRTEVKKELKNLMGLVEQQVEVQMEKTEKKELNVDEKIEQEIDELQKLRAAREKNRKKKEAKMKSRHRQKLDQGIENEFVLDFNETTDAPFSVSKINKKLDPAKVKKILNESEDEESVQVNSEDLSSDEEEEVESEVVEQEIDYDDKIEKQLSVMHQQAKENQKEKMPMSVQERRMQNQAQKKAKQKKRTLEKLASADFADELEKEEAKLLQEGAYENLYKESSDEESDQEEMRLEEEIKGSETMEEVSQGYSEEEVEEENVDSEEAEKALEKIAERNEKVKATTKFFDNPIFNGLNKTARQKEEDIPLPFEKTDKYKRKLKRKKSEAKKANRVRKKLGEETNEDEVLVAETVVQGDTQKAVEQIEEEERSAKHKELIKKGMGKFKNENTSSKVEVVPSKEYLSLQEPYNFSDYDSDENAKTVALAGAMLKKSDRRKILDQAYNRYAFNDPEGLPDWFVDDETRHFKPQLPITKAMVDKVRARNIDLTKKSTKKVVEARARKRKRIAQKMETAKRKATSVVENEDLGAVSKKKLISKIYKNATKGEDYAKKYVVGTKMHNGPGGQRRLKGKAFKGKKVKLVDKRMRSDKPRGKKSKDKGRRKGKKK